MRSLAFLYKGNRLVDYIDFQGKPIETVCKKWKFKNFTEHRTPDGIFLKTRYRKVFIKGLVE